jgi:hypothetical protein
MWRKLRLRLSQEVLNLLALLVQQARFTCFASTNTDAEGAPRTSGGRGGGGGGGGRGGGRGCGSQVLSLLSLIKSQEILNVLVPQYTY